MKSTKPKDILLFDSHHIRLMIGIIVVALPVIVICYAGDAIDTISASYYTGARNFFVGLLFAIGAYFICYKGRKIELKRKDVGCFWKWLSNFWKGAINFRIKERRIEEDLISWAGGIAAILTAIFPTSNCVGGSCPFDLTASLHAAFAVILFLTTVYFCLGPFLSQIKTKIKKDENVKKYQNRLKKQKLRRGIYIICGYGILVLLVALGIVNLIKFTGINNIKFWLEFAMLWLFGFAWLTASRILYFLTDETERINFF